MQEGLAPLGSVKLDKEYVIHPEMIKQRLRTEGMAEMIEKYLRKLPNCEQIIKTQVEQQFPNDEKTKNLEEKIKTERY